MRKQATLRHLLIWMITVSAWALAVWGAWIPAKPVATRVLGVDMAEVVKFLPGVRAGQVSIWREGFLLPQVTLSLLLALHAWQPRWPFPRWVRVGLQGLAVAVALSMLPPPWSPTSLRAPEWRWQVRLILFCLFVAAAAPLWRYLPARLVDVLLAGLGMGTALVVVAQLTRVWPEFEGVYNVALSYGTGVWAVGVGATGLLVLLGEGWRHAHHSG